MGPSRGFVKLRTARGAPCAKVSVRGGGMQEEGKERRIADVSSDLTGIPLHTVVDHRMGNKDSSFPVGPHSYRQQNAPF